MSEPQYIEVSGLRNDLCIIRQPRHRNKYKRLLDILEKMGVSHPYRLERSQFKQLFEETNYLNGTIGNKAEITSEYLYRFTTVKTLMNYLGANWTLDPISFQSSKEVYALYRYLFLKENSWLSLSRFSTGRYSNPRKFTFWTSDNLSINPLNNFNKVGYPSNWIDQYMVILRCRAHSLPGKIIKIPTILDAFTISIFLPMYDSKRTKTGFAIDLKNTLYGRFGFSEVVIGPIGVGNIELFPLEEIDYDKKRHYCVEEDDAYLDLLNKYYYDAIAELI